MFILYDEGACDRSMGLIKGLEKGAGKVKEGGLVDSNWLIFPCIHHLFFITRPCFLHHDEINVKSIHEYANLIRR